jgi:hypothetical protein
MIGTRTFQSPGLLSRISMAQNESAGGFPPALSFGLVVDD